jgi:BirA family biotin operon repressor/biotin-[acetyl-CoA-carboxylase] ligase
VGDPAKESSAPASVQLNIDQLQAALRTHSFARQLRYTPSTASTNADALMYLQRHAAPAALHGMAIIAEEQTAGRGRRGRAWHSPALGNIYCSVIAIPARETHQPNPWFSWVPLFSALAAADCLSAHAGLAVSIKWPNDLLIDDKKLGGVLCEQTTTADRTLAIIIGIGLNINASLNSFPSELRPSATSLAAECGRPYDRIAILADLFLRLEQRMDRLGREGASGMIDEFTRRCATLGKRVQVALEPQRLVQGIAESIGPDGCLRLRVLPETGVLEPSSLLEIRSADVVHLRG